MGTLGAIAVGFWFFIFAKGLLFRKAKLPYFFGLYFSLGVISFFVGRIADDTATDRTFGAIAIIAIITFVGLIQWWRGKLSWEIIETNWSLDSFKDSLRTETPNTFLSGRARMGAGLINLLVKVLGINGAYYSFVLLCLLFPLLFFLY